jgi:hypothetical protein
LATMVAVVGLISIIAPWTCQWPTKTGLAVAAAGGVLELMVMLCSELVSGAVDVLAVPGAPAPGVLVAGALVFFEQPAEAATSTAAAAMNSRSPALTVG